jgi:hypothetical protein
MAQTVYKGYSGPFSPLGLIVVAVAGTPVRMSSLIDPASNNAPETFTPAASANNTGAAVPSNEYTVTFQQIMIQGFKAGAGGNGLVNNTGNIYVLVKGAGGGLGNRTDYGAMVVCVPPGQTAFLASAPLNCNVFNPYALWLDSDNNGDSALCMGINQ